MSIQRVSLTRRQFTLGLAGARLAFPGTANNIYDPKLVIHTSTWVREAAAHGRRPEDILDEALGAIEHAGYRRVEVAEEFLGSRLRERTFTRLARLGLEPSIGCASGVLHAREAAAEWRDAAISTARFLTGRAAFLEFTLASKPEGKAKTDDELREETYQLNLLGQELERTGLRLLLNHDAAEMRDNAREWRYLAAHSEARLVGLCVDVESAVRAGVNPWELVDTAGGRLRSLHLRNCKYGVSQELLRNGDINLGEIATLLRHERYDGFLVVELLYEPRTTRHRTLPEALALNRWYMQEVFGSRPGQLPVDMGPHTRFPHVR